MIPSDHFVRFYNEVFKFLEAKGGLSEYHSAIAGQQELHCLELFHAKGLQGMYDYWEHILVEENCDMELTLTDDALILEMKRCPSLSKVIDNDAGAFPGYCDHCPGWVIPVLEKAGYRCDYDLISRRVPRCRMVIRKADGTPSRVFCSEDSTENSR